MTQTRRVSAPRRRTQEERSAATISKLLDATIESLIEVGYEHTTSRSVAERAGVSRGAQSHHFPRRVDLIVSAVERMGQLLQAAAMQELEALPRGAGRRQATIDTLWSQFSSPVFIASVKLWVAAQEDPELYERLVPIERDLGRFLMARMESLVADGADRSEYAKRYAFAVSAIRGLALMEAFEPRPANGREDPWPYYRELLEQILSG
ncbi:MAG TPA: TetR/AcrR family transcriptional regulator [Solirubrobacteraceae bacterium]|nr:TetR/AcrR family transcriptional regulator [Solirubrobacteraceae bacterium]